jgi:uncharacterized protein DUF6884
MSPNLRSLLIVSCSQRKRSDPDFLPALERYDGPIFRVLRRYLKEQSLASLDIFILSAKFGLISANQPIPNYDQRITLLRVQELQADVITKLRDILSSKSYQEIYICMGKDYYRALDGYNSLVSSDMSIKVAAGSPGKKLAQLHFWLYGKSSPKHSKSQLVTIKGKSCIRGIEIVMTPTQVLDIARCALAQGQGDPTNYQSWYVLVDDERVAPKWLVSRLTGLPVSTFQSREARNVLQHLGIGVYRE